MKITLCGSMMYTQAMQEAAQQLGSWGYETVLPDVTESHLHVGSVKTNADLKRGFIDEHFAKIDTPDTILVVNKAKHGVENYIGGNTLIEIAYAYAQGLEVFILNPLPDMRYVDEIRSMYPIVLGGTIAKLDEYMRQLPLLLVSSESPVKHQALSRGLRRAGIRTRIEGQKVTSGVNEQPMSIEESYDGAVTRHANLKEAMGEGATYLATIESGYHTVHKDHNAFGCAVIVLEKVGAQEKIGVDLDVEFPRAMTERVLHDYPDIGVLVQQEYGSKLKDPYPYFTHDKLTRAKVLENAVYNVAVQLL